MVLRILCDCVTFPSFFFMREDTPLCVHILRKIFAFQRVRCGGVTHSHKSHNRHEGIENTGFFLCDFCVTLPGMVSQGGCVVFGLAAAVLGRKAQPDARDGDMAVDPPAFGVSFRPDVNQAL